MLEYWNNGYPTLHHSLKLVQVEPIISDPRKRDLRLAQLPAPSPYSPEGARGFLSLIILTTRTKEAIKTGLAKAISYGIALQMGGEKPSWDGIK